MKQVIYFKVISKEIYQIEALFGTRGRGKGKMWIPLSSLHWVIFFNRRDVKCEPSIQ